MLDWHYMYREVLPALLKEWIEFEIFCRLHFIKRGESFYYKTKYTYGVLCKQNADLGMREGGVHSRATRGQRGITILQNKASITRGQREITIVQNKASITRGQRGIESQSLKQSIHY